MKTQKKFLRNILIFFLVIASFLITRHVFLNWNDFKSGLMGDCVESR